MEEPNLEYAGFWIRVLAALIDTVLLCLVIFPPLISIYGWSYFDSDRLIHGPADFLLSWVLPAIVIVLFWRARQATPGKLVVGARIVDAESGDKPSTMQLIGRYLGYYVSIIPVCLGLIWVAFDPRKQGWHDKLAGTLVVRRRSASDAPRDPIGRTESSDPDA